jgi:hypothetical protein
MRKIAILLALCVGAVCGSAASAQTSEVTNVQTGDHPDATTCSLRRYPKLALVEISGMSFGSWSDLSPNVAKGPPATLSIVFNKSISGKEPWMILLAIDFSAGSPIDEEAVGSWDLAVGGALKHIDNLPLPMAILPSLPPGEAPPVSSTPERGPSFQAAMDDDWFQRIFSARSATVRFLDKKGRLIGSYQWNLTDLGKGKAVLDQIQWNCGKPAS